MIEAERRAQREIAALRAIFDKGPPAMAALELAAVLKRDPRLQIKIAAMNLLEGLGALGESAIPELVETLSSPESDVSYKAGGVLGKLGKAAVNPLIALLESNAEWSAKWNAGYALAAIGIDAKAAIPVLLKLVKPDDTYYPYVMALSEIATDERDVLKMLEDRSEHATYSSARTDAEKALKKIAGRRTGSHFKEPPSSLAEMFALGTKGSAGIAVLAAKAKEGNVEAVEALQYFDGEKFIEVVATNPAAARAAVDLTRYRANKHVVPLMMTSKSDVVRVAGAMGLKALYFLEESKAILREIAAGSADPLAREIAGAALTR